MMDVQGEGCQGKLKITMTTNITGKDKIRQFQILENVALSKYIQLYEQAFDIDLYAYRCSFRIQKQTIQKITDLDIKRLQKLRKGPILNVELCVQYAGG